MFDIFIFLTIFSLIFYTIGFFEGEKSFNRPKYKLFSFPQRTIFRYICKKRKYWLKLGHSNIGLVENLICKKDREQIFILKVPSADGGFNIVFSQKNISPPDYKIGDLVKFALLQYDPSLPFEKRCIGVVTKKIKSGWNFKTMSWEIDMSNLPD